MTTKPNPDGIVANTTPVANNSPTIPTKTSRSVIKQEENKMAEVDTTQLAMEHGDIRREAAQYAADIRYDVATRAGDIRAEIGAEHCKTNDVVRQEGQENVMATKDALFNLASRVGDSADRIVAHSETNADRIVDRVEESKDAIMARTWDIGRDTQDVRAQIISAQQAMVAGFLGVSKDTELAALKTQLDSKENTRYIVDKVTEDGEKTRNLINDLKYHDLNRGLLERNTELVNCEQDRRGYRDRYYDARWDQNQAQFAGQWAQLQSQIQAFQSQLQETRQGMVNFGTMAGVGQSSTSNNVR